MIAPLSWLADSDALTPHGFCLAWEPGLIWLQAGSDLVIAASYYSIPLALVVFARRRTDLAFRWILLLFAAFILACGTTHLFSVLTLWVPAYWAEGVVKAVTAVISIVTALCLWPLIPRLIALPSPAALEREIEARDQASRQLADSEARYRSLFIRAPAAMHSVDQQGRIIAASDMWLDLLGYARNDVEGRPLSEFQEPGSPTDDWTETRNQERRFVCKSGAVIDALLSSTQEQDALAMGWRAVGVLIDVTARKRAESALLDSEERLRQAEKLTALGQLAGGIAHDFNNVLQAIQGAVTLLSRNRADPAAVARYAALIDAATSRASSVTRRLLAFARRDTLRAAPIDVQGLLGGMRELLTHTLGAGITVAIDVQSALPDILADRGQLETVLLNLATNARDAMPSGGRLTLSAAVHEVLTEDQPLGLARGQYVRLSVTDTGVGMDATTLTHAMEPFFTTKPQGKGTGLGLATARGFAEQSGGALAIESAPGLGTAVSLWLPVTDAHAPNVSRDARDAPGHHTVHVLLVDDDAMVREVLASELADRGFEVMQAENPQHALDLVVADRTIDLLISDQAMPGTDGLTLIRMVRERRPGLPAILLTGYANEATALVASGFVGSFTLLHKPIIGTELADRAAELVEAARATDAGAIGS